MTDNTKMREGKLWAFLHDSIHEAYKKLSTTGTSNEYHALLDSIASKIADDVDARFLKAAQAELDAKDARIRELEEANASLEASYRGSCMMYDATKVELKALRKDAFMWEARYKTLAVLFASVAPTVDEIDDSIRAAMQERQP